MDKLTLNAYAKINLSIDVMDKRPDGYHDLKSIMQSVSLKDEITLKKTDSGIKVKTNLPFLPVDERNLAYKAAKRFYESANISPGIDITISKNIPVGAGLAGGSTDAAAVLRGLNFMYGNPIDNEILIKIGKSCGADVPFCMTGGTCLAEGIGERLTPLSPIPECGILLVKPNFSVSTKAIFEAIDSAKSQCRPDTRGIIAAIGAGDLSEICVRMYNMLEPVSAKLYPDIEALKNIFRDAGALGTVMSGSGPSVFGIFKTFEDAKASSSMFNRLNVFKFCAHPVKNINDFVNQD